MKKNQDEFRETMKNKNINHNDAKIAYLDKVQDDDQVPEFIIDQEQA